MSILEPGAKRGAKHEKESSRVGEGATGLRRNAIGIAGMIFLAIAAMTPLATMSSNVALLLGFGAGPSAVLIILTVAAVLVFFTFGFVVLSRHVTSSGAYQAFVAYGLGDRAGTGVAFAAVVNYTLASSAFAALTGFFSSLTLEQLAGVEVPWWVFSGMAIGIGFLIALRGVTESSRLTAAVSLMQLAMIVVLAVAVLIQRPGGWLNSDMWSPSQAFGPGLAFTIVFTLLLFTGFETTAVFGEEVKAPRRSVAIATFGVLGVLLVVVVLGAWTLIAAFDDVQSVASKDAGSVVTTIANEYVGAWAPTTISILVAISFMGAVVTTLNLAMRYLFDFGRDGVISRKFAKTHPRHATPYVSLITVAIVSTLVLVPFALSGADPLGNLLPVISAVTCLAGAGQMVAASLSIIVAKLRGKVIESAWVTVVTPLVAAACLTGCLVLILLKYDEVTGSSSRIIYAMPVVLILIVVAGFFASSRRVRPGAVEEVLSDGDPSRSSRY